MKKLSRNTSFALIITFFLFIILFFIRMNRMFYAFKEFNFHITSFKQFIFFILSFFQDFFFCFIIYFFSRAVLGKFKSNKTFIPASVFIIVLYVFIMLYQIFDLIYFKTSGRSISWQSIMEADRLFSLWDSAIVYLSPFLIFIFIIGIGLLGPGSFITTKYFMQIQDFPFKEGIHIPRKILIAIIILLLFFTSQIFLLSINVSADVNSIPIFKLITSYFTEINSHNEKMDIENNNNDWEKFDLNSRYNPLTIIDKKIQLNLKDKISKIKKKNYNVIYFLSESTFAGYYPMYGGNANVCPFLQKKAGKSLLFKNFYSTGVRSINTLISLLSGLNSYPGYKSLTYVNPGIETPALSELLKDKGYNNALVHSGNFEFYYKLGFLKNRDFDFLVDEIYLKEVYPDAFTYSWGIDDRYMVRAGLNWIDRQVANKKNFFLTFVPIFPHHPYTIPPDVPKFIEEPNNLYESYLNSLHFVDLVFQELYTGLERRGLLENTIIVFVSDHGEAFGQHKGNFGHENCIWEENVHLPCMIFNPEIIDDYYEFESIVTHSDVFATICDILDIKNPIGSQGTSVLDMNMSKVAFFASGTTNLEIGLRDGKYKAIYNFKTNSIRLYDLSNSMIDEVDISEKEPLLAIEYKKRIIDYYRYEKNYQENFNDILRKIKLSQDNVEEYSLLNMEPYFKVQDFYEIQKNISAEGYPIIVNDVEYKKGYGVHANSIMKFNLKNLGFKRFKGKAAKLQSYSQKENYVEMQIIVDGRIAFSTGKLTINDDPINFDVDIKNAESLELLVLDSGDNQTCDSCSWIDPVLMK